MDLLQQYKRRGAASAAVNFHPHTASSSWFRAPASVPAGRRGAVEHFTFAATATKKEAGKPEKTIKKKEGKQHAGPKKDSDTSDANDSGPCWSDHERVPGTEKNTKGSCRPQKNKTTPD